MENVFYVKDMYRNLLSYAKITDKHKILSLGNSSKIVDKENNLIAIAWKEGGLYKIISTMYKGEVNLSLMSSGKSNMTIKEKWHRILGHVNFNYLNTTIQEQL